MPDDQNMRPLSPFYECAAFQTLVDLIDFEDICKNVENINQEDIPKKRTQELLKRPE